MSFVLEELSLSLFRETCGARKALLEHVGGMNSMKKDSKRCCDTTMPKPIHTKDESKRGSAFAFIFGVN